MYMPPATKAAAQLIIKRPDGTETRFVRHKEKKVQPLIDLENIKRDEDREAVAACPPYTASFNTLLKERREKNSRVLVNAVLERMHAESIPLNVVTYNLLMERVVCSPDDLIFTLYEEIKEEALKENSSVQPNLTTYQLLFRACERKGQYNKAFLLYKQMKDLMHITPDSPTYDTLLGFCAAVKDVAQASYFVEEMKQNGVNPDVNTYNCLMSVLVDSAPYEETLHVFQQMIKEGIKPTIRTYNTISKAARAHGDYDRAFQLFEEMKKHGMLPDVVTYNTLLCLAEHRLDYVLGRGAHSNLRRTFEQRKQGKKNIAELSMALFNEMESMKILPNTFTFNQLMTVLLKCEDHRVFKVYRKMQEVYKEKKVELELQAKREAKKRRAMMYMKEDLNINTNNPENEVKSISETTNTINTSTDNININMNNKTETNISLDEVIGMEDPKRPARIAARQSRPNVDSYRLIVKSCLQFGLASKCDYFYREMCREGLIMDHDFAILLESACEIIGDKERAFEVLEEAKEAHVLIDSTLYNAYLNVLASLGDEKLIQILEEMRLGINCFNVKPDVNTFNTVLRGYLRMGNYKEASKLFSSMYLSYSQVIPNSETYCWILRAYCQAHDTEAATLLLQSMRQRNVPVLIQHYHELMKVYLESDDDRIIELFNSMKNSKDINILPKADTECFCIFLQYYLRQKQWSELEELFVFLKADLHIEPDIGCYNVMLEMFLIQERVSDAKVLFDELRMKCVTPDISAYNKLLRIFAAAGDVALYSVLEDMKNNYVAPAASTLGILMEFSGSRKAVSTALERGLFWNPTQDLEGLC